MEHATPSQCDVLVIGGGPAGATVAPLLAAQGYKVVVLEKARFPRFHILHRNELQHLFATDLFHHGVPAHGYLFPEHGINKVLLGPERIATMHDDDVLAGHLLELADLPEGGAL